jgi:hypothetical protein
MELTQGPPPQGEPEPPQPLSQPEPPPDPPVTAAGDRPVPTTVRRLGLVLQLQAACYGLGALAACIGYLVRGADTLSLGAYATTRTHPATMLSVGLVAAGLLVWLARRIPARPLGLWRLINIAELVLLADGVIGVLFGIFNIWWIAGLLAAFAARWYLRAEDTNRYLD